MATLNLLKTPAPALEPNIFQIVLLLSIFFKKNGPTLATFSFIFGLFQQTLLQFLQQIYVTKCWSSIWCQDSNLWPSECESLPITTRPGLPPYSIFLSFTFHKSLPLSLAYFLQRAKCFPEFIDAKMGADVCFYILAFATIIYSLSFELIRLTR